jgi:hypothetical protein
VTPSPTQTSSPTVTATATVTELPKPVTAPYPDPSNGSPINFPVQVQGPSEVTLSVFTLAFREIYNEKVPITGEQTLQWDLKDREGNTVANGLYYVRIQITGPQNSTTILKVLVLR